MGDGQMLWVRKKLGEESSIGKRVSCGRLRVDRNS